METTSSNSLSRRAFMGQASCAALGSAGLISTLLNTQLMGQVSAASNPTGYKALVCFFLFGGNDSFNMLAPKGPNADNVYYKNYAQHRKDIALLWQDLTTLNSLNGGPIPLGIHNRLPKLARIYNQDRKLAFLANVGTLIQPGTNADNISQKRRLPLGAYSHSDQQQQWQTCFLEGRSAVGWGGLMTDTMYAGTIPWSSNISIGRVNIWQTGDAQRIGASQPFSVSNSGVSLVRGPSSSNAAYQALYQNAMRSMFGQALESSRTGILERIFHRNVGVSTEQAETLAGILNHGAGSTTSDPDYEADWKVREILGHADLAGNSAAADLLSVARFIALRKKFPGGGPARQTFFVGLGGWDHHDEVLNNQNGLFKVVDDALDAFYRAMAAINAGNQVTLFSSSDFGRTLSSNGRGSDHGWGGNAFVIGGAVRGGRIYGTYPDLGLDSIRAAKLDAGRGRVIPTTAVDQYFGTLAKWMGVSPSSREFFTMFPNLANWSNASDHDLGFMV